MESFSFSLKVILFTVLLVWLCQMKIDNKPIEKHFIDFVRHSPVTEPIHRIGDGSRKLANDGWRQVQKLVGAVDTTTETTTKSASLKKNSSFKWSWDSGNSNTTGNSDRENVDSEDQE